MAQRIKVFIRPKPLTKEQIKTFVSIDYGNGIISLNKPSQKVQNITARDNSVRSFAFTKIFLPNSSQQEIYENSAFSLIENVLEGYNGTIFTYGQTGSGKTYTIMGGKEYLQKKTVPDEVIDAQFDVRDRLKQVKQYVSELKGIIPRSFNQLITVINSQRDKKHLIQCSFIEIYNENVYDLLGQDTKSKLSLKENANKGLVTQGLKTFLVKSVEQLQRYFRIGYKNRSIRQTSMNKESSRSHCIFTIKIEEQTTDAHGNTKFKVGKLNLVDLAGSQRQSKMTMKEQGVKQATKINLSLSALGKVINCLSNYRQNQKAYIPYRDSKLTRILQDSLGGNTKTVMIATISQNSTNYEQTLSTLIYASRAKFIQNRPIMNEDPKDVLLRQYVHEIQKLKTLLMEKQIENEGLRKTTTYFKSATSISKQIETINEVQQSHVREENLNNNTMQEAQIKKKLEDLQNIVKKQSVNNEQQIKELKKMEQLKKKIKLQQERQAQLQRQKRIKEQELQLIEKDYNNLNEQAGILRTKFKDLKGRYAKKEQELEDFKKQFDEQREDFDFTLRQKDKQIKKLEKLLETVLEQQAYKQIVDQDEYSSDNENLSNLSYQKVLPKIKVENKAKVNFNSSKSLKSNSERQRTQYRSTERMLEAPKIKINSQTNLYDPRNYQSQHEKKVKMESYKSSSSYTNLNMARQDKNRQRERERQREKEKEKEKERQKQKQRQRQRQRQRQIERQRQLMRKASIKKVDSMISLKAPKRDSSVKLPFITQVKKLSSPKKFESQYDYSEKSEYTNKLSLDIAKIRDQIINELKSKSKVR